MNYEGQYRLNFLGTQALAGFSAINSKKNSVLRKWANESPDSATPVSRFFGVEADVLPALKLTGGAQPSILFVYRRREGLIAYLPRPKSESLPAENDFRIFGKIDGHTITGVMLGTLGGTFIGKRNTMGNNHLLPSFRFKFNILVVTPAAETWIVYDPDFCLSNLDFGISDYQIDHTNYGTAQKIPTDFTQDGPFTLRVNG